MKTRTKILAILALLALCSISLAEKVTIEVTGVVNSIRTGGSFAPDSSVSIGSLMTGFCTYDTDTPDLDYDPDRGFYSLTSLSMTIGNYTLYDDPASQNSALFKVGYDGGPFYRTMSNSPRFDGTININGSHVTYDDITWQQYLLLFELGTLSSITPPTDELPTSFPDLSLFDWVRGFRMYFTAPYPDSSYLWIGGEISSVIVTIAPGPFEIAPADVDFHYYLGDPNPEPQILSIWAKEVDTLNWQITEDCNWLDVSPTSGQSSGEIDEVTLSVDISGLDIGSYSCLLTVYDPNVPDCIHYLPVNLFIGSKLFVPSQYLTIQAAIDAAENYDIVLVADGTYTGEGNRDIDFLGKAITVRSESGPENCIIDCNGTRAEPHQGLYFHSDEDRNSAVSGFSIRNGYAAGYGGGIFCGEGSSPKITNCIISANAAMGGGGIYCVLSPTITNCTITDNIGSGIYCSGGSPTIANCIITGNSGWGRPPRTRAGGIYCGDYSSPTITNCIISANTADGTGGGIYCDHDSSPMITSCTITGHMVAEDGGGIYCRGSSPTITHCTISDNCARYGGGGIACEDSSPTITNCVITANTSEGNWGSSGGGVYFFCGVRSEGDGAFTITNCAISGNSARYGGGICCGGAYDGAGGMFEITNCDIKENSAEFSGGGIYCGGEGTRYGPGGIFIITDCTINGNSAASDGGAIYCEDDNIFTMTNCIMAENQGFNGGGIYFMYSNPTVTDCTIAGNTAISGGGIAACDGPITNCVIIGNSAFAGGGGLYYCDGPITNCTITGNSAISFGGGLAGCRGPITNCIIWNNVAVTGSQLDRSKKPTYSCIQDWTSGGQGNIYNAPCFIEPSYWADANDPNIIVEPNDPNAVWIDGDYHLLPDSPCIDAGDPNYIPEPNETDLDGNPRVNGGRIDMGAYESIMHEAYLWLWPRVINRKSRQPRITAWLRLPQGITKDQIDNDVPLILHPGGIEAVRQFVFQNRRRGAQRTSIFAFFDKAELMDAVPDNGPVQLQVLGHLLEPGQYFYGSDTVRIITRRLPHHRR